ncbi:DNA glycosylase [Pavlovales sp. CCMP2436]|nr:DNA glycosylase [Pavlovales sp. CCMP2436]
MMALTAELLPVALAHLRAADPQLAVLLDASPTCSFARLTAPAAGSAFSQLCKRVVAQQLSGASSRTIFARVVAACAVYAGTDCGGELSPASLLGTADAELRAAGLSAAKLRALKDLAAHFADGRLSEEAVSDAALLDDEQLERALTAVVGIGPWTCHMFMLFWLKRCDVLPVGDLAVRKGFLAIYGERALGLPPVKRRKAEVSMAEGADTAAEAGPAKTPRGTGKGKAADRRLPSVAQMEEIAECWRPFRSLGTFLMYHSLSVVVPPESLPDSLAKPPQPLPAALPFPTSLLPPAVRSQQATPQTPRGGSISAAGGSGGEQGAPRKPARIVELAKGAGHTRAKRQLGI